jgi:hypothetical protein
MNPVRKVIYDWTILAFEPCFLGGVWFNPYQLVSEQVKVRMNRRDAGCSTDGFVIDFHVQGLHEPNLESHVGSEVMNSV